MGENKRPKAKEKHIVEIDDTNGFNLTIRVEPDEYCMSKFKEIFSGLPKAEWIEKQDLENLAEDFYYCIFRQEIPSESPTIKQIQQKLEKTEKALRKLYERLSGLDNITLQYVASKNGGIQLLPKIEDIAKAHEHICSLVSELKSETNKPNRGKKKDSLRSMYLEYFVQIYQLITGAKITLTWDEYSDSYKGDFYDFVTNIFDVADISYSEVEFARDALAYSKGSDWP